MEAELRSSLCRCVEQLSDDSSNEMLLTLMLLNCVQTTDPGEERSQIAL